MNHTPPEVIRFRAALTEYREVTTFLAKHDPDYPGYRLAEDKAKMLHDELETSFCKRSPLPFREAGEKPKPDVPVLIILKNRSAIFVDTAKWMRDTEEFQLDRTDGYNEHVRIPLGAIEGWLYESDILNLFTAWKEGKQ